MFKNIFFLGSSFLIPSFFGTVCSYSQPILQVFLKGTAAAGESEQSSGVLSLLRHSVRPGDHQVLQSTATVHLPALSQDRRQHLRLYHLTERFQVRDYWILSLILDILKQISSNTLYESNISLKSDQDL